VSCPHGNGPAAGCSQCLGYVPRLVQIERTPTGDPYLTIDGRPHGLLAVRQFEHDVKIKESMRRGATGKSRRPKRCGLCGEVGHTRLTCSN